MLSESNNKNKDNQMKKKIPHWIYKKLDLHFTLSNYIVSVIQGTYV